MSKVAPGPNNNTSDKPPPRPSRPSRNNKKSNDSRPPKIDTKDLGGNKYYIFFWGENGLKYYGFFRQRYVHLDQRRAGGNIIHFVMIHTNRHRTFY